MNETQIQQALEDLYYKKAEALMKATAKLEKAYANTRHRALCQIDVDVLTFSVNNIKEDLDDRFPGWDVDPDDVYPCF